MHNNVTMTEVLQNIRPTAKGILWTPDRRILTVRTQSDLINLPGGGIDTGESPYEAFIREIKEELPGFIPVGVPVDPVDVVVGGISRGRLARWHVFEGGILLPIDKEPRTLGQIPAENQYFELFKPKELLSRNNITELARVAVENSLQRSSRNYFIGFSSR